MTITLPIAWIPPGLPKSGTVTVTFNEVKLPEGYHVRQITDVALPIDFPMEQRETYEGLIYYKLNIERQKVVLDDARINP